MFKKIQLTALAGCMFCISALAQVSTNKSVLERTASDFKQTEIENFKRTLDLAKQKGWPVTMKTHNGNIAFLTAVDPFGLPIYTSSQNNIIAAATTGASKLWSGGSSGLNLSGSSNSVKGKMAVWDEGGVLATHVELTGRVLQKDNPSSTSEHSTHVAGTMIASGVNPLAKGMAFGLQQLLTYDFNNHISEMSSEAPGLLISNHSYGTVSGWSYNSTQSRWEFYGRSTDNEDYKFGYYDNTAQMLDSIAYNAPNYLIVKSAGNHRSENGPAIGQPYYRFNASGQMTAAGNRPAGISNNDSYDIIPTYATAKNILTVGAIYGLANGYSTKDEVTMSTFSSWGPTDDGRIKPDIVADGVNVLSSVSTSNSSYSSFSGTSMATPNSSGSLLLLQEYYAQLHAGTFMRSATLKALAIHTADEAGDAPGPDYKFGWGVLNVAKGADVIKANNTGSYRIFENVLNNTSIFSLNVIASGQGPLVATIVWTDPKADVDPTNVLNNTAKKLVNDLDIRITQATNTYFPWVLDPGAPYVQATTGNNIIDNVEKINIDNPIPGATYTIQVSHKGTLARGSQAYSLVLSGVGGQAYCASSPTSNTGTRIDSVSFGSIHKLNVAGCTTYNNYTSVFSPVEPNQTLPIAVKLGSCDATSVARIVKVFIDFNNNGDFSDAGELVATSSAITGAGTFNGSVLIPATVTVGNSTIMRIVVQETSNAANVTSCGSYNNGETQDYKLNIVSPSNDMSMVDVVAPEVGGCSNASEYVTVRLRNNSQASKQNIPLKLTVKNGSTTIATATAIFAGPLTLSAVTDYTFSTPVNFAGGNTYSVETIVTESSDQLRLNDTLRKQVVISNAPAAPSATGEICGTNALLSINNASSGSNYFWYTAPPGVPFASGTNITTATIPANNTYYVTSGARTSIGPATKLIYPQGGYNTFSGNWLQLTATVPTIIETARLYIGNSGTIKFVVNPMASSTSYYPSLGDSVTLNVTQTSPTTPILGNNINDPNDTGSIYRLNLKLDNNASGNYIMFIYCSNGASIYRSNNILPSPYPVGVPQLLTITGNSATDASDPNYYQKFYYFFYDMKVRTLNECVSNTATIVAPVAPTPVITVVNDSLVSSVALGNQWYLNGNAIAGANDKKYKPTQSGAYSVTVFDNLGCSRSSATFNYTVTAVNPVANAEVNLRVSPNPANGIFNLSFNFVKRDDLKIDIMNAMGQLVYTKSVANFSGNYSEGVNIKNSAAGVYVLKIQHGSRTYFNKIVLQ